MIGLDTVYDDKRGKFVNNYSKQQLANIDKVYNYLINTHKLTPILAVALMGNIMQESAWDPKAKQIKGDEAIGLFQLHGDLLKAYRKYLRSTGKNEDNILSPIDYVIDMIKGVKESNGKYLAPHPYTTEYNRVYNLVKPNLGKANLTKLLQEDIKYYNKTYGERVSQNRLHLLDELLAAWNNPDTSVKDLTTIFTDVFERAGEPEYDKRASYALEYYDYYNPSYKVGGKLNKYKTGGLIKKLQFGGNPMAFSNYVSPEAFNEGTKQVASGFNWLMDKAGDAFARLVATAAVPSGSATGSNVYANSPMYRYNLTHVQPEAKKIIEKASPYISPSNYIAAITLGSLNPKVGAEFLASDPRLLALGITGDILSFKYAPKAVKPVVNTTTKVTSNIVNSIVDAAARAGNKTARTIAVARELRKPVIPEGYTTTIPKIRTRVGDVETNNPQLAYRQGTKDVVDDFISSGEVRTPEGDYASSVKIVKSKDPAKKPFVFDLSKSFENPMFAQGSLWYGVPKKAGSGLLTTAEPLGIATKESRLVKSVSNGTFDLRYPDVGKSGRRVQLYDGQLSPLNTSAYLWEPGYGYRKIILREPKTSLAFFERRPSKISEAERIGIPKGERFVRPFRVANYPGYLLKGLMKGSLLERLLSKNGTININLLNSYFNKASQLEREVANKVLAEKFFGQKTIDYNLFKKAVLDELIGKYNRVPLTEYADYGIDRLGFKSGPTLLRLDFLNFLLRNPDINGVVSEDGLGIIRINPDGSGTLLRPRDLQREYGNWMNLPKLNTFTFESPRIPYGNIKHYDGNPVGHSRTYILSDDPHTLYIMESQSDWAQNYGKIPKFKVSENGRTNIKFDDETMFWKPVEDGTGELYSEISNNPEAMNYINNYFVGNVSGVQPEHLAKNYLQRQLQENLRYAAENGLTKMRYPTSETAAKIEGYLSKTGWFTPEGQELDPLTSALFNPTTGNFEAPVGTVVKQVYSPEHRTILKKYADFPKLFLKLFKDLQVRTVTDAKGNTWYEVDVPKGYLSREWLFKQGGLLIPNNIIKRFKYGRRIQKSI